MVSFIRDRGLEREFQDYCGGWPCRVASLDDAPPAIHNPAAWFYSDIGEAEWWSWGGDDREATIRAACEQYTDGRSIWIVQAKRLAPVTAGVVSAARAIEDMQDSEVWGEDGWEGFGDEEELQRRLDVTMAYWFAERCSLDGAQLDFIHGPERIGPGEAVE